MHGKDVFYTELIQGQGQGQSCFISGQEKGVHLDSKIQQKRRKHTQYKNTQQKTEDKNHKGAQDIRMGKKCHYYDAQHFIHMDNGCRDKTVPLAVCFASGNFEPLSRREQLKCTV